MHLRQPRHRPGCALLFLLPFNLTHAMTTSTPGVKSDHAVKVVQSVTVRRPAADLYNFWRNPENIRRITSHPVQIAHRGPELTHWCVTEPITGHLAEWDAQLINDKPNELIAWESTAGAGVANAGTVRFTPVPGGRDTEVTVQLEFVPPGGMIGAFVAKLSRFNPEREVAAALQRFKALMEAEAS